MSSQRFKNSVLLKITLHTSKDINIYYNKGEKMINMNF